MSTVAEQDIYADIRPYHDDEVAPAIARLIADDEFIHAILHYRFPAFGRAFGLVIITAGKILVKTPLVTFRQRTSGAASGRNFCGADDW